VSTAYEALWIASLAIFVFFAVYTLATFALIALSLFETALVKIERGEHFTPPPRLQRPGISLIATAYNMEPLIVVSARSLLALDYEPLEVLIVDDGSTDGTTAALIEAFDLIELPVGDRMSVPTAPINRSYVSRGDPRLRVIVKENGGRSDAINAGLNVAGGELVAFVDGDTLVEADALKRIAEVFAADPDHVVAVGGTIRIANGAVIEEHAVATPRLATSGIEASQTAEYLRSFFAGAGSPGLA
jgi:cellulose synthase/poly-beta-1,6-N-acetylglucosamine synthase-like glycosyltransferase